jgi:hypothetical protein
MTTSFAHFVRGDLRQALSANVSGVCLALACALQIPWCWLSALRGRLVGVSFPAETLIWLLIAIFAVTALNWFLRLMR